MRVWIGMTSGMAKHWIIPRVGDKELPRVGHQPASCNLLISYVLTSLWVYSHGALFSGDH